MKSHFLKTVITTLLFFNFIPFGFCQEHETVTYFDDGEYWSNIENRANQVLSTKIYQPIAAITEAAKQLENNRPSQEKINLPTSTAGQDLNGEMLFNHCKNSVFTIGKSYNCGRCHKTHTATMATAFAITSDGVCVTNYHVLRDLIKKDTTRQNMDSLYFVGTIDGKLYPLEKILAYSEEGDIAIFKVTTGKQRLQPIQLGAPAGVGAAVRAITNPDGRLYYYSEGVVSRNIKRRTDYSRRMEITADYAKGSSGGPILNTSGQLIGMVSTTSSIYYEQNPQKNLQMVIKSTIPVVTIKQLLN